MLPEFIRRKVTLYKNANHDIEAGGPVRKAISSMLPWFLNTTSVEDTTKASERDRQFRPDAKIWELYLTDAEAAAKDRAEIWKTGLDSLLIFAGLFAGVVSSFLVDANGSNNDTQQRVAPPSSLLWVKGLWLTSLLVTIFSAIMGVLAKAWVAKFMPVTSKREAKDAYHRRILDKRAEHWRLELILTFIPLLLQVGSFLFLFGIVVQSFDDDPRIGKLAIVFVVLILLTYSTITIAPVFFPASPFQTPLSDLFLLVKKTVYKREVFIASDILSAEKVDLEELAEIWFKILLPSTKASHVDEAVAEATRQWSNLDRRWKDYYSDSGASDILVRRLREYTVYGLGTPMGASQDNGVVFHHLESLLQLIRHSESSQDRHQDGSFKSGISDVVKSPEKSFTMDAFRGTIESIGPLYRWNVFREDIRPLAFSLRTHIMIHFNRCSGRHPSSIAIDFALPEVEERPWELMFHQVQPQHRLHFIMATCRGLVEGQKNTQTVCSHILSLSIANAAKTMLSLDWSGDSKKKDDAGVLIKMYLAELFKTIVQGWETTVINEAENMLSLNMHQDPKEHNITGSETLAVFTSIRSMLDHPDDSTRVRVVKLAGGLPHDVISNVIPKLAELIIQDPSEEVRSSCLDILPYLTASGLSDAAFSHLVRLVENSFISLSQKSLDEIQTPLENLLEYLSFDKRQFDFHQFEPIIGLLIQAAVTNEDDDIRAAGRTLLQCFTKHESFLHKIKSAIDSFLRPYFDDIWYYGDSIKIAMNAVIDCFDTVDDLLDNKTADLWVDIFFVDRALSPQSLDIDDYAKKYLGQLLPGIERDDEPSDDGTSDDEPSDDYDDYYHSMESLRSLVSIRNIDDGKSMIQARLNARIGTKLKSDDWETRLYAIRLCQDPSTLVESGIADSDSDVREAAFNGLKRLIKANDRAEGTLNGVIKSSLSSYLKELRNRNTEIQVACIDIIGLLAETVEFDEGISALRNIAMEDDEAGLQAIECLIRLTVRSGTMHKGVLKNYVLPFVETDSFSKEDHTAWMRNVTGMFEARWVKALTNTVNGLSDLDLETLKPILLIIVQATSVIDTGDWTIRKEWIILLTTLIKRKIHVNGSLTVILKMAMEDTDDYVQNKAIASIAFVLENDNALEDVDRALLSDVNIPNNKFVDDNDESKWLKVFTILTQKGIRNALQVIAKIAISSTNVEETRIDAMRSLTKIASMNDFHFESLDAEERNLLLNIDVVLGGPEWEVRKEWIQLFHVLTQKRFPGAWQKIMKIAQKDEDYDVRAEAIEYLSHLVIVEDLVGRLEQSDRENLADITIPSDLNWRHRQEWVKLFCLLSQMRIPNSFQKIVEILQFDSDNVVIHEAISYISSLIQGVGFIVDEFYEADRERLLHLTVPKDIEWRVRIEWVKLFYVLAQNRAPNALQKLLEMAQTDSDSDVVNEALQRVSSLLQEGDVLNVSELKRFFRDIPKGYGWRQRIECVKAWAILTEKDIQNFISPIAKIAREDPDEDVREEAMHRLTYLIKKNNKLYDSVNSILLKDVDAKIDPYSRVRMEWVNLFAILTSQNLQGKLDEVVKMAKDDEDEDVRAEAVQFLATLVQDTDKDLQDSDKKQLFKFTMTLDLDVAVRLKWINFYTVMIRKHTRYYLPFVVNMARVDKVETVRIEAVTSLIMLFGDEKFCKLFNNEITFESNLDEKSVEVGSKWIELLDSLQKNSIVDITSSLTEMTVLHCNENVQERALRLILELLRVRQDKANTLKTQLSNRFESGLKNDNLQFRCRAMKAVEIVAITEMDNGDLKEKVLRYAIPVILKIAMTEEGEQQSQAKTVFQSIRDVITDKVASAIFTSIPQNLTLVTEEGRRFIVHDADIGELNMNVQEMRVIISAARNLAALIKGGSMLTRATATELLSQIYTKYLRTGDSKAQAYDVILDIIRVALDENGERDARIRAFDFLRMISNEETYLDEIKRYQQQFMTLLEKDHYRLQVVPLISQLAKDAAVRKAIISQIISLSTTPGTHSYKGYITLLCQLLVDQRLDKEPMDYVMILLACTVVKQPKLAHLRFQVVSALWCYYHNIVDKIRDNIPDDLVNWFEVALFGRHATTVEVETWCEMSKKWIPHYSGSDGTQEKGVDNSTDKIRIKSEDGIQTKGASTDERPDGTENNGTSGTQDNASASTRRTFD